MTIPDLTTLCDGRSGLRSLVQVEVREPSGEAPGELGARSTLDFVASTATLDRYQEVIEPAGWRLDSYRRNPVFQNAHNYGDILFTLGKALVTEVRTMGERQALCQRIQFATEVNPVARIAYGLYRGGFLNAVSVGFIPVKWETGTEHSGFRRRFLEQELLEVSAVAIPANPDALALGVKAGAVSKGDLRETLELLRGLLASGEGGAADRRAEGRLPTAIQQAGGLRYLDFAREVGRIMRKA